MPAPVANMGSASDSRPSAADDNELDQPESPPSQQLQDHLVIDTDLPPLKKIKTEDGSVTPEIALLQNGAPIVEPNNQTIKSLKEEVADVPSEDVKNLLILPDDPVRRLQFLKTEARQYMTSMGLKCKIHPTKRTLPKGGLNDAETQQLVYFLDALLRMDPVTAEVFEKTDLRAMLDVVLNQTNHNNYEFEFPSEAVRVARQVFDYFESEKWGKVAEAEVGDSAGESTSEDTLLSPTKRKRQSIPASSTAGAEGKLVRAAPRNHPIYGTNGIMHDILRPDNPVSYKLAIPKNLRPSYNNFGHNGLTVGQWWPLQVCLIRDGAHGSSQGGIYGTQDMGAMSIIVSGAFKHLDEDRGHVLFYSGSNSHSNRDPRNPNITKATESMRKSHRLHKDIRLFRSSGSGWGGAPVCGLRYDGLYRITNESTKLNAHGGAYIRFRLERQGNQDPIDRSRPNAQERKEYELVKHGY